MQERAATHADRRAIVVVASAPKAPAPAAVERDIFDMHPTDEANKAARNIFDAVTKIQALVAPWLERDDVPPDDRWIIRHALGGLIDAAGRRSTEMWRDD